MNNQEYLTNTKQITDDIIKEYIKNTNNSFKTQIHNYSKDYHVKEEVNFEKNKPINYNTRQDLIFYLKRKFLNLYQVDLEAKDTLLYGAPQGGKSAFSFANAAIQMELGKPCIFIVRNYIKDAIHMSEKAKRFSESLVNNKFSSFDTVYAGDMSCTWKIDKEDIKYISSVSNSSSIENALFGNKKQMVIVLSNFHQLSAINHILQIKGIDKLMLFIDEADSLAYGLEDIPTNIEFNKLKEMSNQTFEITATPLDNLVGNKTLETQNIIVLQPPSTYKGIRNIEMHDLQYPIQKFNGNLNEEDPNLKYIYDQLSSETIFSSPYVSISHPIIVLHKTSTSTIHHDTFFEYFKDNYHTWITIKEDSKGLFLFADKLRGKTIFINKYTFSDKKKNGIFNFKNNIIIPQLLQWMFDNGGATVFSHIVIKSGRFSGRSRSYVSTDGNWHLTHQYYFGAASAPSLIQEMRIVHDRPDAIPLKCYVPSDVGEAIQKGAIMLDEQIERLIDKEIEKHTSAKKYVENGVWNPEKIPKKVKLTIGSINKDFKINKTNIGESDGGWKLDIYEQEMNKRIKDHYTSKNTHNDNKDSKWKRDPNNRRLNRKNEETCVELLRKSIKTYVEKEHDNNNTWKTAKEWLAIIGLCGFKNETSYHHSMMTYLVKEKFLERQNNKLRLQL